VKTATVEIREPQALRVWCRPGRRKMIPSRKTTGDDPMVMISEVMTANVAYVEADATVRDALRTMHDSDVRHVPVLDDGELVGILSDRDLQAYVPWIMGENDTSGEAPPLTRPVSSLMSSDVRTVSTEDDLREAIDIMIEHKVGAVPVVDRSTNELVGIVSYVDALRLARDRV
jgi:acetoin utilization protein AcuB